jgi:heat shock protein HslJ
MNSRNIVMTLLAGLTLLLAACAGIGGGSGDPLDGTTWQLVSLEDVPPIAGTTLTATFENGELGGSAGCNSYGGNYQVSGEPLSIDQLFSTLMACTDPQGVMEQEQSYLSLLGDAQGFELSDGQLVIFASGGQTLTFAPLQ